MAYKCPLISMRKIVLGFVLLTVCITSSAQSSGYEKAIEVKGAIGLDDRTDYAFGASMINGYRFNDYLFLGAGVGYEYLNGLYYHNYGGKSSSYDSKSTQNIIQLYVRVKANFTNAKISPFASLDLGNSFNLDSTDEIKMAKGFFFEPAIGCDFKLNDKQTFYISLGYSQQQYEYEFISTAYAVSGHETEKKPAGMFNIHIGLKF